MLFSKELNTLLIWFRLITLLVGIVISSSYSGQIPLVNPAIILIAAIIYHIIVLFVYKKVSSRSQLYVLIGIDSLTGIFLTFVFGAKFILLACVLPILEIVAYFPLQRAILLGSLVFLVNLIVVISNEVLRNKVSYYNNSFGFLILGIFIILIFNYMQKKEENISVSNNEKQILLDESQNYLRELEDTKEQLERTQLHYERANKQLEDMKEENLRAKRISAEMDRKTTELSILFESSQALGSSTLSLEDTMKVTLDMVRRMFDCQTVVIFLAQTFSNEVELVARKFTSPYSDYFKNLSFNLDENIVGWAAKHKIPVFLGNVGAEATPILKYERSIMVVPFIKEGEVNGAIYVGHPNPGMYGQDELNLLSTLANQASVSIINAQLYERTSLMATTDGLTGLYTHRYFQERLQEEVRRAQRYHTSVSMMMVDTDNFKKYNDTYGHPQGDAILVEISRLLKGYTRDTDIVCRYGGDEFGLILVETDKRSAIMIAERIREAFQLRLNQKEVRITASIGVANYPEDAKDKTDLIKKADEALYNSKNLGRNKVSYHPLEEMGLTSSGILRRRRNV